MKILMMLAVLFTSLMVAAKPARTVASKNDLGIKIRIDDAQAKELYFKIETKGAKRSGTSIIQLEWNNITCVAVNSHGAAALEGFSCEIQL